MIFWPKRIEVKIELGNGLLFYFIFFSLHFVIKGT